MKCNDKREIAELAIRLYNNLDEAEQFSQRIPEMIRHLDEAFLLELLKGLKEAVEDNIENRHEVLIDDKKDLDIFIVRANEILEMNK